MKSITSNLDETTAKSITYYSALTHSGDIHCDDVFAAVIIDMLYRGNLILYRVPNIPENVTENNLIIFGTGKTCFDPESPNAPLRGEGKKYSSAGLVWKKHGRAALRKLDAPGRHIDIIANNIYKNFIRHIDNRCTGEFNPAFENAFSMKQFDDVSRIWTSDEESNEEFCKMFDAAYIIFNQVVQKEIAIWKARANYKKG